MAIICSKHHSTRDFSFKNDCFVAEASDLGLGAHDGRVYDDACDVGFVMVSHITGDSILFVQSGQDLNGDEIAGWRYEAKYINGRAPGEWRAIKDATLQKLGVLVIND